jgi:hypothetical protein
MQELQSRWSLHRHYRKRNGFDAIGGMILGLFKRKRRKKNCSRNRLFHSSKKADQKFYLETLKLKANEIELFLQFCEADPKSNNCSKLQYAEYDGFCSPKNTEFKKLGTSKK